MRNSNSAEADTPVTHILDFFCDSEDACALIARINDVRFHITAHPYRLQSKSGGDGALVREYKRRLKALRNQAQIGGAASEPIEAETPSQTSQSDAGDSGVDVQDEAAKSSPSKDSAVNVEIEHKDNKLDVEEDNGESGNHEIGLQNWILSSFSDEVSRLAPKRENHNHLSLYDWYYTPAAFFELIVRDGQLTPEEIEETPNLRKRVDDLLPSLPMPKYIRSLPDLPMLDPHDITVLTELTHNPSIPIHPALVRTRLPNVEEPQELFFKPVDPTQPSPVKREISLLHRIHSLGLDKQINVPRLHALVSSPPVSGRTKSTSIMGLLLTPIPTPATPLTEHLTPSSLPEPKRLQYAEECQRIISVLHDNDIVFGDAKADNFLVDKNGKLWIIDFGGSYTEGWVDAELEETKEGDNQGVEKVRDGLLGADESRGEDNGMVCEDNTNSGEEKASGRRSGRGKKRQSSEEGEEDIADVGRRQKKGKL